MPLAFFSLIISPSKEVYQNLQPSCKKRIILVILESSYDGYAAHPFQNSQLNNKPMGITRKEFINQLGAFAAVPTLSNLAMADFLGPIQKAAAKLSGVAIQDASNEDFWLTVQQGYDQSKDFINLENGYYLPSPKIVTEALVEKTREINSLTSFYMRRRMAGEVLHIREKLAAFSGVPLDELLVMRNTTEALDTVILGLDMAPGDQILLATSEYSNMMASWDMRAKRFGINLKKIELPLTAGNDAIIDTYRQNITDKTKYILISHIMNVNGQILPVKQVADLARQKGIQVICDAAHSFAHLDYKVPDLAVDYFGTSLHKWTAAPLGTGFLQIRKENIHKVWPLFGDNQKAADDITKFEQIGTAPWAIYLAIESALDFNQAIGTKRKEERLRYLKNYWVERVQDLPGIIFNTPINEEQSCAITNFAFQGKDPRHTADYLFEKHKIFTVAYDRAGIKGVRVTPNIHNSIQDLDKLVTAIQMYSKT